MNAVTRLTDSSLAMLLFLSSQVMLFGSFFSVFVALNSADPNFTAGREQLNKPLALLAIVLLLGACFLVKRFREVTLLLVILFLFAQSYQWLQLSEKGVGFASSNYWGLYFLITGLHVLQIAGGIFLTWTGLYPQPSNLPNQIAPYWGFSFLVALMTSWVFCF